MVVLHQLLPAAKDTGDLTWCANTPYHTCPRILQEIVLFKTNKSKSAVYQQISTFQDEIGRVQCFNP
uniref:Uncharacterized protein n=1 Tax=Anguilla anguilla TaxID=7936 RepID=A0A0E9SAI5_ANGAN